MLHQTQVAIIICLIEMNPTTQINYQNLKSSKKPQPLTCLIQIELEFDAPQHLVFGGTKYYHPLS